MTTVADMTPEELEVLIERVVDAKLADLLSQAKPATSPDEWLPNFFDTFGSFKASPLERDDQGVHEVRLDLK